MDVALALIMMVSKGESSASRVPPRIPCGRRRRGARDSDTVEREVIDSVGLGAVAERTGAVSEAEPPGCNGCAIRDHPEYGEHPLVVSSGVWLDLPGWNHGSQHVQVPTYEGESLARPRLECR